jgi:ribosome-associated toxin RatA of RatAB toxin-antitoxin module
MSSISSQRIFCLQAAFLVFLFSQACSSKYTLESKAYRGFEGEINQHTRLIQASRERIFEILTNEESFREICPKSTIVTFETPPPYRVGTLIRTKIAHIFKLAWNTRVEELSSPSKIRLHFLDGFFAGGTEIWEIESLGERTRVLQTIIFKPIGILSNLAWALKVRTKHDKMVEAVLDNLQRVSERHPTE